jgi:hypothetical protein
MKYRNPKKDNDLFSMIDHQQEVMCTVKGINKLNAAEQLFVCKFV